MFASCAFRISTDLLHKALKRYNITDDWRQYALYIVHGDQERCLGLEEKPLLLFKQLDKEGRKPMFMLRRHASPQEGWSNTSGSGAPTQVQEQPKVSTEFSTDFLPSRAQSANKHIGIAWWYVVRVDVATTYATSRTI